MVALSMEKGFLSQKGKGRGNGVKKKQSTTDDLAKVTVSTDEVAKSTPHVVPEHYAANNPGTALVVDRKVVEGVDESVNTISKSFASLVTNEVVTIKVNLRSLDSDKPINAKVEVKIPKAFILDVHSRFRFSLYGYFSWGRMDYARALIDIRADRELKEDMVIVIPNVEDDGKVLHTVIVDPSNAPLVAMINKLESQMIEGKLVLLGDDGKSLKPSKPTPLGTSNVVSKKVDDMVNEDSDIEV
ncbi:hypothetical protein Tco_0331896 [Tanacetum coccineum]